MSQYRHASIVGLGGFNPLIFQPKWLEDNDIFPKLEFARHGKPGRTDVLVSGDVTILQLASVRLEVTRERWVLATERPDWVADLGGIARSIFQLLPETPIHTIGFNDVGHFRVDGGERLAREWLPIDAFGKVVGDAPILCGTVRARWNDYTVQVELQPSSRVPNALFIGQNYQRELKPKDVVACLLDWRNVLARSASVVETLTKGPT